MHKKLTRAPKQSFCQILSCLSCVFQGLRVEESVKCDGCFLQVGKVAAEPWSSCDREEVFFGGRAVTFDAFQKHRGHGEDVTVGACPVVHVLARMLVQICALEFVSAAGSKLDQCVVRCICVCILVEYTYMSVYKVGADWGHSFCPDAALLPGDSALTWALVVVNIVGGCRSFRPLSEAQSTRKGQLLSETLYF